MRNVAKLPKTILALEALGGVLIASALLVVNQWLPALPAVPGARAWRPHCLLLAFC